jgi:hypothetical protein
VFSEPWETHLVRVSGGALVGLGDPIAAQVDALVASSDGDSAIIYGT